MNLIRSLFFIFSVVNLLASCKVDALFNQQSEYEKYVEALRSNELANTALAQDWINAGRISAEGSLSISLPYAELTRFDPADPKAIILKYPVKEGQTIQVILQRISNDSSKVFLNAYEVREDDLKKVANEAGKDTITYKVEREGEHLIRIQPELLRGGLLKIQIGYSATLAFPLPGKSFENISSFYGDARDAGRRKHEGIDIFSPRGTPVVAVLPGFVRRVSNNNLGGKVIFVSGGGYSFYYAHLDSQLVSTGQRVEVGDTLGLVGNTGNAITTAPHLHFGIYSMGKGALDPSPFFASGPSPDLPALSDTATVGNYHRVKSSLINLRAEPTTTSAIVKNLKKHEILTVEAILSNWYRVKLPDGAQAFVYQNLLESVESPLREISLADTLQLKDRYLDQGTYSASYAEDSAEILGKFQDYFLLLFADGHLAWLPQH